MDDIPDRQGASSHGPSSNETAPRLVAFVVSDDRLFASRHLPMARAAIGMGISVAVITTVRDHRAEIEATGARVVALEPGGSGLNPMTAGYAAGQLSAILKALKAGIVHCIGLRSILTGGTAAAMAGIGNRVYAPTGLGPLGEREGITGRLVRTALKAVIRGPLASRGTRYLFETPEDARALGLDPADIAATILDSASQAADAAMAEAAARIYAELLPGLRQ